MRVVSKFLTAEVRVTKLSLEGRKLRVEGLVKDFMPMTVELSPADAAQLLALAAEPLRRCVHDRLPATVQAHLPARLRRLLEP